MAFTNILGLVSLWLLTSTIYAAPAMNTPRSTADNTTTTTTTTTIAASAASNFPLRPVRSHHGSQGAGGNFRPRKSVQLAWQTPNNESAVTVGVTMQKTAVVLEDIDQVSAVDCSGDGSVSVSFNTTDAYHEALSEWSALNGTFVLITNHMGDCDSELERSFFVTDSASIVPLQNNVTIVVLAEKSDLMSTANSTEFDFSSGTNTLAAKRSLSWNNDGLSVDYNYSIPSEQTIIDTSYVTVVVNEATIANSVSYSGHAKWELFKGVTEFYIDVDKSIYHYADIDVTVKAPWTDTWSWAPDALSYSVLDVPGIISLGPSAGITFGGKFTAAAGGSVTGQFTSEMPNGTIHMDLKDWDSSYSEGWQVQHEAVFNITEDVSLTLAPYIDFTVEFACKLFDGLVDLSTGVKAEPSFPFVTTASTTQSVNTTSGTVTDPSSTSGSACANGIEEAIDFKFDITAFATKWASVTLYEYEADLWDDCLEYASLKKA